MGNFDVNHNELKSTEGFPDQVNGVLNINGNKNNQRLEFKNSKLMKGCIR